VLEYWHQWRIGIVKGLVFDAVYAVGREIENSVNASFGQAKKSWYEFGIKIHLPCLKRLRRDYVIVITISILAERWLV